jgi:hypothetical protein
LTQIVDIVCHWHHIDTTPYKNVSNIEKLSIIKMTSATIIDDKIFETETPPDTPRDSPIVFVEPSTPRNIPIELDTDGSDERFLQACSEHERQNAEIRQEAVDLEDTASSPAPPQKKKSIFKRLISTIKRIGSARYGVPLTIY